MVKFNEKENLKNQIEILKKNGVKDFLFLLNNFDNQIKYFLKKNYSDNFIIHKDKNYFGTGGCQYDAKKKLQKKILIVYSDLYFNYNFENFIKKSLKNKCLLSCVAHANDHPQDSDTVFLDKNFYIKKIYKKNSKNFKINNAIGGIYLAKKKFLKCFNFKKGKSYDLVHDIMPQLIKCGNKISVYKTIEYIKDFGTSDRIKIVKKDIKHNKIKNLNFFSKTKSVFLDRDGVINQENKKRKILKNFKILPNTQNNPAINPSTMICMVFFVSFWISRYGLQKKS